MSANQLGAPDYRGQRALVMGLGSFGGGLGAARFLCRAGAEVTVTDLRSAGELEASLARIGDLPLRLVLGEHREEDFTQHDLVVANPAVAPSNKYLAQARAAGVRVVSDIELFLEHCPARVVAITGTQGKSSTTHMTGALLQLCGLQAHVGGNIGRSPLEFLSDLKPDHVVVLELSSYMLEAIHDPARIRNQVEAVCVVNVLVDHLERHGSLEAYAAAKRRILELLSPHGTAILPGHDARISGWPLPCGRRLLFWPPESMPADRPHPGLFLQDEWFTLDGMQLARVGDLHVPGSFQRGNALAALGLAYTIGASAKRLTAALPKVSGLEHRMQDLGRFRGHRVIDNGVSTTPDSTIAALESLQGPCVLLCGGKQKSLPLGEFSEAVRAKARLVVCFGSAAQQFARALRIAGVECLEVPDVERAVGAAFEHMREGEELLFSPACASFDAYLNFEQRASAFRRALALHSA